MKTAEIIAFINNNLGGSLATVEKDKPHVRGIYFFKADPTGLVFHTGTMKHLHQEIQNNPNVECSFFNPQTGQQIRVRGIAQLNKDQNLLNEIIEKREFIKKWVTERKTTEFVAVYKIIQCEYTVWEMAKNFETTVWTKF